MIVPPELWAIAGPILGAIVAYFVSSIRVAGQRRQIEARQSDLADQQSKYIFEQWKSQNEMVTAVRIQLAESLTELKSLAMQLQEARANSAERDRLLGILEEKDRQKTREIEHLTLDFTTESNLRTDLQRQLSDTVEKLERTTHERDEIQKQLVELLPLIDEQARQAEQIQALLESEAARHEQVKEWQAAMMDKDAELARANARIVELEAENTQLRADLARATADLELATIALAKATLGTDAATASMDRATASMDTFNAAHSDTAPLMSGETVVITAAAPGPVVSPEVPKEGSL